MSSALLRSCWIHPADFVETWLDRAGSAQMVPLLTSASVGGALYGAGAGLGEGAGAMLTWGAIGALTPAVAWACSVPTLFILGTHFGSALRLRQVMLISLSALSFSGVALAAALPLEWFLELSLPFAWAGADLPLVHGVLLGGAWFCGADVLLRILRRVEPSTEARILWGLLMLFAGLGIFLLLPSL